MKRRLRREKERTTTQRFILVHPSSSATSNPLSTSKEFQYKTNTLAFSKSTLHPAAHSLLHTRAVVKQCRTLLHNPNYKPCVIWETN